jgi:hypothetical protein
MTTFGNFGGLETFVSSQHPYSSGVFVQPQILSHGHLFQNVPFLSAKLYATTQPVQSFASNDMVNLLLMRNHELMCSIFFTELI